jgi:hypothetical protein
MMKRTAAVLRRIVLSAAALIGLAALLAADASAIPFSAAQSGETASDTILVRDGCGRGLRWSNRRQACVPDDDVPIVRGCPPGFRFSEGRQRCVPIDRVIEGCPRGYRWSNSRRACVPAF